MSKQIIEIEVPDGKKAVWDNNKIVFVPKDNWRDITTWEDVVRFVRSNITEFKDLVKSYNSCKIGSYEEKVAKYRLLTAVLTHNEKRHLVSGDVWFPVVQFCRPEDKGNCWGNMVVGTIESEGEKYLVVGGYAIDGTSAGLSNFDSYRGVSWTDVGFRSVSSKEIAEHISKYFGKLLFEVHYGGTNCDWKWVD